MDGTAHKKLTSFLDLLRHFLTCQVEYTRQTGTED
jgi:hypothetical protein